MRPPRRGPVAMHAVVGGRSDFRESSRLVTLWTAERGRVLALAKGAHRRSSQFIGRLDFLCRVDVELTWKEDRVPLLNRVSLIHEPRTLRRPHRFLAACHLADLSSQSFLPDRPDRELFDLLCGGLSLLERVPEPSLLVVICGLELRLLAHLGLLPVLDRCTTCAAPLAHGPLQLEPGEGALACRRHADPGARPVQAELLTWLSSLLQAPGRTWARMPPPPSPQAAARLLGHWLDAALHRPPRLRRPFFAAALAAGSGHGAGVQ